MPGNAAFPFYSDVDLHNFELLNARLHQLTSTAGLPAVDGCLGYVTASGDKRIYYYDADISAAVKVPRLDRNESLTGGWTITGLTAFARGAATPPFTTDCGAPSAAGVTAGMVVNLDANFLKGYDLDSNATANTLGLRTSTGTMLVANTSGGNSGGEAVNWNTALTLLNRGVQKAACKAATTGSLPAYSATATVLTMSANGALTIDGVVMGLNDRLGVLYEGTGASAPNLGGSSANNGLFYVSQAGDAGSPAILTRTADADESAELTAGDEVFVDRGTVNGGSQWALLTMGTITVGTTAMQWTKVGGSQLYQSGNGIVISGNNVHFAQSAAYTANTIPYANGTATIGFTNATASGVLVTNNSSVPSILAAGTTGQILQAATTPSWSTATYPTDVALGDVLYGSAAHVVGKLGIGTAAYVLQVNGAGNAPAWFNLFGTANTWSLAQTFSAAPVLTGLSGIVQANGAGAVTAITGTAGALPKWSSTAPYLSDSGLSDDGTTLSVALARAVFGSLVSPTNSVQLQFGTGSANGYCGTIYSSASTFISQNAGQDQAAADHWAQCVTGSGWTSQMICLYGAASGGIIFYQAPNLRAADTLANFWIERWRIANGGILQAHGAQTIQTDTGVLTLLSDAYVRATSVLSADTGFRVNNSATSGHVLRGNGTNFVDAALGVGDVAFSGTQYGVPYYATAATLGTSAAPAGANVLLHGNAAGAPTWSAVVDADFSGQLAIAHGGTGQATAGAGFNALSPMTTLG
ncbi:MAG: hypothetical protein ACYDH9_08260, partial [Limisphaerales bacterium]